MQLQLLNEKNLAKQLDLSVAKLRRDRFEKRGGKLSLENKKGAKYGSPQEKI